MKLMYVNEELEDVQEVNAQLKAQLAKANDEVAKLKQLLSDVKMEITKLQKEASRKYFGIEACQESNKDVQFYTGSPSVAELLEYLSPSGKRSNVVYNATAQKCMKEGSIADPGTAEWRESDLQFGHPSNLSQADELLLMLVRLHIVLKVWPNILKCYDHRFHGYFLPGSITVTSI